MRGGLSASDFLVCLGDDGRSQEAVIGCLFCGVACTFNGTQSGCECCRVRYWR
jgi:hypothetical protein